MSNYTKKTIKRILIEEIDDRGNRIKSVEKEIKGEKPKRGWNMMYKKNVKEAIEAIKKEPNTISVWLFLWEYLKKDGTIDMPLQKVIASELGINERSIRKAIKRLKNEQIIGKDGNKWYYNPYMFMPYGIKDEDAYKIQKRWDKLFGEEEYSDIGKIPKDLTW